MEEQKIAFVRNNEPLDARGAAGAKISIRESNSGLRDSNPTVPIVPARYAAVPNRVLAQMLLSAFRYALGRRTYIVGETARWMEQYWLLLAKWHKQIHEDIERAIESGRAGDKCDIEDWRKILRLPVHSESAH